MAHGRIELEDVLNFFEYEKVRDGMRRRVIESKRARRVPVGRYLSFVFENRETLLFQIQEMCRAERITDVMDHPADRARTRLSDETKGVLLGISIREPRAAHARPHAREIEHAAGGARRLGLPGPASYPFTISNQT